MKETKIQVAAPEGGIIYDCGSTKTAWQNWSDEFRVLCRPRLVYSKYVRDGNGKIIAKMGPYVRPKNSAEQNLIKDGAF